MYSLASAALGKTTQEDIDNQVDFGLYYPVDYAFNTWQEHRTHGTYPEAGGYNDQDEQLMTDWRTLNARFNRAILLLKDDDNSLFPTATNAKDWTNL